MKQNVEIDTPQNRYLKRVYFILKEVEDFLLFDNLIDQLLILKIAVNALLEEEVEEMRNTVDREGILCITDSGKVAKILEECKLAGLCYLSGRQEQEDGKVYQIKYAFEDPKMLDFEYLERVYRRSRHLPWNILETKRCIIRETIETDVDYFFEIYSNQEITKYTEGLYPTIEAEKNYVNMYYEQVYCFYEFGIWTVIDKESGSIIGRAGLNVREGYDLPELGFVIDLKWQGKGIAYEICVDILKYAKEILFFEQVQAFVEYENEKSNMLCEKLGFVKLEEKKWGEKKYFLWLKTL